MADQSMSEQEVQRRIDDAARTYDAFLREDVWTLEYAHSVLRENKLDLFHTAGLAKAIACFQCSAE